MTVLVPSKYMMRCGEVLPILCGKRRRFVATSADMEVLFFTERFNHVVTEVVRHVALGLLAAGRTVA